MKYYEKLISLGCFSLKDVEHLTGNAETARTVCKRYLKKGYIERIKRDLYVAISLETGQPIANRFAIASRISDNATVSFHSALEYYGYANQVTYEVQVMCDNRFRDFDYDGFHYQYVMPRIHKGIARDDGVRITSLERTIIDCICNPGKAGGTEELLRCLSLIPALNEDCLLLYLEEYNNGYLYQKAGCVLSYFSSALGLTDKFFDECKKHLPSCKTYLYKGETESVFYKDWNIYAPASFAHLINKGVNTDYAV